jgi:hypothetical protein
VPVKPATDARRRRALMEEVGAAGIRRVTYGVDAARSQDFLYDEGGLPK